MGTSFAFSEQKSIWGAILAFSSVCLSLGGCGIGQAVESGAKVTLLAEHGTLFYAFDTLSYPEKTA